MSDDSRLGLPPAGWRYDSKTGDTRWWDGADWTDHSRPLDPVVRTAPARPSTVSPVRASTASRNGAANTGLVLLVIAGLAIIAAMWLGPGMAPASTAVVTFAQFALAATAFAMSLVGLVVAIVRRTGKSGAVIGLLLSGALVGFLAFQALASTSTADTAALEAEIAAWATSETGQAMQVECPTDAPDAAGAIFACTATDGSGTVRLIAVTVGETAPTWELAP